MFTRQNRNTGNGAACHEDEDDDGRSSDSTHVQVRDKPAPSILSSVIFNFSHLHSDIFAFLREKDLYNLCIAIPFLTWTLIEGRTPLAHSTSFAPEMKLNKRMTTLRRGWTQAVSPSKVKPQRQTSENEHEAIEMTKFWRKRFQVLYSKQWNLNLPPSSGSIDPTLAKTRRKKCGKNQRVNLAELTSNPFFWRSVCLTAGVRTCPECGIKCPPEPRIEEDVLILPNLQQQRQNVVRCPDSVNCNAVLCRNVSEYEFAGLAIARCGLLSLGPLLPPELQRLSSLDQLYSSTLHGSSLRTLRLKVGRRSPVVIVVTQHLSHHTKSADTKIVSEPFGAILYHPLEEYRNWNPTAVGARSQPDSPSNRPSLLKRASSSWRIRKHGSLSLTNKDADTPAVALFSCVPSPSAGKWSLWGWVKHSDAGVGNCSVGQKEATTWEPSKVSRMDKQRPCQWVSLHNDLGLWVSDSLNEYDQCAFSLASDLASGTSWMSTDFANKRSLSVDNSFKCQSVVVWGAREFIEQENDSYSYSVFQQHNRQSQNRVDKKLLLPHLTPCDDLREW